jgi:hypothetical protein
MVSSVWREVFSMRKSIFVIAVAAAACSGVALAGEVKQDKAQVVKATTMSDAQMDKVTAGDPGKGSGDGVANAWGVGKAPGTPAWQVQGFKGNAGNK